MSKEVIKDNLGRTIGIVDPNEGGENIEDQQEDASLEDDGTESHDVGEDGQEDGNGADGSENLGSGSGDEGSEEEEEEGEDSGGDEEEDEDGDGDGAENIEALLSLDIESLKTGKGSKNAPTNTPGQPEHQPAIEAAIKSVIGEDGLNGIKDNLPQAIADAIYVKEALAAMGIDKSTVEAIARGDLSLAEIEAASDFEQPDFGNDEEVRKLALEGLKKEFTDVSGKLLQSEEDLEAMLDEMSTKDIKLAAAKAFKEKQQERQALLEKRKAAIKSKQGEDAQSAEARKKEIEAYRKDVVNTLSKMKNVPGTDIMLTANERAIIGKSMLDPETFNQVFAPKTVEEQAAMLSVLMGYKKALAAAKQQGQNEAKKKMIREASNLKTKPTSPKKGATQPQSSGKTVSFDEVWKGRF